MRRQIEQQKGFIDQLHLSHTEMEDKTARFSEEKTVMQQKISSLQYERNTLTRKADKLEREKTRAEKRVDTLKDKIEGTFNLCVLNNTQVHQSME